MMFINTSNVGFKSRHTYIRIDLGSKDKRK